MSDTNPTTRDLDDVISARLGLIQQSTFEAAGIIEAVKATLYAQHEEYIGDNACNQTAIIDLVNALRSALTKLANVTDRLDLANLCNGSRRAVVESRHDELVDDAA